jgi:hypothetical protein
MATEQFQTRFQLLCSEITIVYDDPGLQLLLSYIALNARQNIPITAQWSYQVRGTGPYEIYEEGDLFDQTNSLSDVQFHIYQRSYRRILDRYITAGWIALHAGIVQVAGQRMLLMGDKGAGKTTLTSRLLTSGHAVEGDEIALVRRDDVMACPRRLHIKPGIEKNVPALAPHLANLPTSISSGVTIRALDPTVAGYAWNIISGPLDKIIYIAPNHGGETTLEPLSTFNVLQRLLENYLGWGQSKKQVRNYAMQLSRRDSFQLNLGNAESAVTLLEALPR